MHLDPSRSRAALIACGLAAAALLCACTVGPNFQPPVADLPATYRAAAPAGAELQRDWWRMFGDAQLNTEWDSIWRVRTRRTEEGWVAEFAIPFRSLMFPAGSDSWGFNISRSILRKLEDDRWSAARLDTLAQGYHSKELAAFVGRYRTEDAVPPP